MVILWYICHYASVIWFGNKIMCTIGPMIKSSSVMMFSYSLFILFQVEGKLEPGVEKKGFHIKQLPFQSMGLVLERKYLVAWNRSILFQCLQTMTGSAWGPRVHRLSQSPSAGWPITGWPLACAGPQSYFLFYPGPLPAIGNHSNMYQVHHLGLFVVL